MTVDLLAISIHPSSHMVSAFLSSLLITSAQWVDPIAATLTQPHMSNLQNGQHWPWFWLDPPSISQTLSTKSSAWESLLSSIFGTVSLTARWCPPSFFWPTQ
jgi:hypothetical protein